MRCFRRETAGWVAVVAAAVGCAGPAPESTEPEPASVYEAEPRVVRLPSGAALHRLARIEGYGNPATGELWMRPAHQPGAEPLERDGVRAAGLALTASTPGHCTVTVDSDGQPNDNPAGTFEYYNQFDATADPMHEPSFDPATCHARLEAPLQDGLHLALFTSQGVGCAYQHLGNFSGVDYSRVYLDIDVFNGNVAAHSPYGPPFTTGTVATPEARNAPFADLGLWDFGPMPSGAPGQTSGPHLKEMWTFFKNGDSNDFTFAGFLLGEVFEDCGAGGAGDGIDDDCDGVVDNGCAIEPPGAGCFFDDDCASDVCVDPEIVSGIGAGGGELGDDQAGTCVGSESGDFADALGWTLTGSATISGGTAVFPDSVHCTGGTLEQTLPLGTADGSEPLVLAFEARKSNYMSTPELAVLLDGALHLVTASYPAWAPNRICLGPRAYSGGDVTVAITNFFASEGSCTSYEDISIDDVRVERAAVGECPTAVGVPSGDFPDTGSSWAVDYGSVSFSGGQANLSGTACNHVSLRNRISIPDAATEPNTALQFTYGASGVGSALATKLSVRLAGQSIAEIPLGASAVRRVCLPSVVRGAVAELTFATGSGGGLCADTWSGTLADVSLVTDPACAEASVMDSGFEGSVPAGGPSPWLITRDGYGVGPNPVLATGGAQAGAGHAHLPMAYLCRSSSMSQLVQAPEGSVAAGGPALSFWYSLDLAANGDYLVCAGDTCVELPVSAGWEQETLCIPPSLAGKPVWIRLEAWGGSGGCSTTYTQENMRVDSLALVQDLSCPWP